ncbi:EAL domain-containing protein [Secundilactobacillus silagei]|uniref:EAL domain-containing protein n=1 Tax=Secundilactobacillus silagei TaxID=1293415 RepID=UPI000AF35F84|nr:hypothetical protein [Secundilactobacillus silagei]
MYRYFIQPQLNKFTNSLVGYETLIRKYDEKHWSLPQNFEAIPVDEQVSLLKKTAHRIGLKVGSISFNLNRRQFIDPQMAAALIGVQREIFPVELIIEVTEEESDKLVSDDQLLESVKHYTKHGIQVSADDVAAAVIPMTVLNSCCHTSMKLSLPCRTFAVNTGSLRSLTNSNSGKRLLISTT